MRGIESNASRRIIVVKAGTDVLVKSDGSLDTQVVRDRIEEMMELTREGFSVVFVVSGAAAKGRKARNVTKSKDEQLVETMVFCSIGMPRVIGACEDALVTVGTEHPQEREYADWVPAQLLLTRNDVLPNWYTRLLRFIREKLTLQKLPTVKDSLEKMWEMGKILPVVNANDPVSSEELTNSDNDKLAGALAERLQAQKLVFLSSVPGLLEDRHDHGSVIRRIDPRTQDFSHHIFEARGNGTGGMLSKYSIAESHALRGHEVFIGNGKEVDAIRRLLRGEMGTMFTTKDTNAGQPEFGYLSLQRPCIQ